MIAPQHRRRGAVPRRVAATPGYPGVLRAVGRAAAVGLLAVAWVAVPPAATGTAGGPSASTLGARAIVDTPGVSARSGSVGAAGSVALVQPARSAAARLLDDAIRDRQWQLAQLDAAAAWRLSTGRGVIVAVIDSGVDGSHPDLAGQVLPGIDLVRTGDGRADPVGHGTTVAALIAGRGDDSHGVVGLAPDAKILPIRVLDEQNRYDDATIVAKAVRWAADNGARVINLSLGGDGGSPALASAIDYAFARDVVVVACAGNLTPSSQTEVWYPAREPGVVAVAGLRRDGVGLWSESLTGPQTVLTAPATGLTGARPGGYWQVQGTSFAAPLVAATAALIRARWPDMPAGEVVQRLISTAHDLGPPGRDATFGFGRVDPVAALNAAVPETAGNPLDDSSSPAVVGFGPAPGLSPATGSPHARPHHFGGSRLGVDAGWAARPKAGTENGSTLTSWGGAVLLVIAAAGGALLIRRYFSRPLRRRLFHVPRR